MQYQARGDYRAIMPGQEALLHLTQQNAMDHSGGSAVSCANVAAKVLRLAMLIALLR
jgi:hypothetical protein